MHNDTNCAGVPLELVNEMRELENDCFEMPPWNKHSPYFGMDVTEYLEMAKRKQLRLRKVKGEIIARVTSNTKEE